MIELYILKGIYDPSCFP